ncbi:MAG TPA: ABC transporter substrate-binding protein [Elusimicrobiota bacterium]|nr:ABC transporter substrate-binding protein [Elusimicrobiota bacterium]
MALSLALAALLAAGSSHAEVKNPNTFVHLSASDANSLDPAWSGERTSFFIIQNLYETLFTYDGGSLEKMVPLVAEKVPTRENGLVSQDGLTYTIPIRSGIRFHDGTSLTAEDARYSLMRCALMDAGVGELLLEPLAGYRSTFGPDGRLRPGAYRDLDRAVRVEGANLVLRLPQPFPALPSVLARWSVIVSKRWAAAHGDWDGGEASWASYSHPKKEDSPFHSRENGSGPFRLERWDRAGQQVVLARSEGYWRKPAALKRVIVRAVPEFATRKLMLEAGDADAIAADRALLSQLRDLPGVQVLDDLPSTDLRAVMHFCLRVSTAGNPYIGSGRLDGEGIPPGFFADRDVRLGFAYAFDYEGFRRDVYRGRAEQARGFIPKGMPGYDPALPLYALDLGKAEAQWKKALGGEVWRKGFRLPLAYMAGSADHQAACQLLKRNLEALNPRFRVDVRALDVPALMDGLESGRLPFHVRRDGAPFLDPHAYALQFMLTDRTNSCRYSDADTDRLTYAALHELDPRRREELYHRLLGREHEEAPDVVLFTVPDVRVQRSWVKGYRHNPMLAGGCEFYGLSKSDAP